MRDGRVCHVVCGVVSIRGEGKGRGTYILETFTPSTECEVPESLRGGLRRDIVYPCIECIQQLQYLRNSLSSTKPIDHRSCIMKLVGTSLQLQQTKS